MRIYIKNSLKMSAPPNQIEETFTLFSEKKIQYLINFSNQSGYLLIEANTIESIPSILYKKQLTLDEIKSNKYFKICDSIEDVLFELRNVFKNNLNNVKISEGRNKLILTIPLPSYLIKEVIFAHPSNIYFISKTFEVLKLYIEILLIKEQPENK